jgi:hypothetical protein
MPLAKALIINKDQTDFQPINVMYNPPSLKIKSNNLYADYKTASDKGKWAPQFIRNENDLLTVELFFDTTRDDSDVSKVVKPILDLAKMPKNASSPPKLVFAWGEFSFPCIITSIDQTYDYFDSSGRALRATLTIVFLGYDPEAQVEEKLDASAAKEKTKKQTKVKTGDTVQTLAMDLTGDPKSWRQVALENDIDNPLSLKTGEMVGQTVSVRC